MYSANFKEYVIKQSVGREEESDKWWNRKINHILHMYNADL